MALKVVPAERVKNLPPYLFAEIDRLKAETQAKGVDVIDLGVGDPDLPTFKPICEAMKKATDDPANHRYPSYTGMTSFLEAISKWYQRRFGVTLHPTRECVTLIGSKEGISHISLALINPDDFALVPDPGYPVYEIGTLFAGGQVHFMPLLEKNQYLVDFAEIPTDICKKAKVMHLNYPHNPTGAVATADFYRQAIAFARDHDILICADSAYTELYFDSKKPLSFLEIDGARDVGIEFHSLSKTYNMTGWRLGMACGHADIIAALGKIKTNIDSGQFQAVQFAGIAALEGDESLLDQLRQTYQDRRDTFCQKLDAAGIRYKTLEATFYVWAKVPKGITSAEFAKSLLTKAGIVGTPGTGFGPHGEGYVRFALCKDKKRLEEAGNRILEMMKSA